MVECFCLPCNVEISRFKKIISRLNNKKVDVVLMKDDINWNFNDTYDFVLNGSLIKNLIIGLCQELLRIINLHAGILVIYLKIMKYKNN